MSLRNLLLAAVCVLSLSCFGRSAAAHGYGFPSYGSWAYGSSFGYGFSSHAHYRSRSVYRPYWGGYRTSLRVGYGIRPWGVTHYRAAYYPRYYYRPTYYVRPVAPVVYPVIYTPVIRTYVQPLYVQPTVCANTPVITPSVNVMTRPTGNAPVATSYVASRQTTSAPAELIDLVDRILQVGAYGEAAKAYAALSVRFGSSQELLTRRYVAHVLNGDLGQAEILVSLSELTQRPISSQDIPHQDLRQIIRAEHLDRASEQLAQRALAQQTDAVALRSVAHWLDLCGDQKRSELFLHASSLRIGTSAKPAGLPAEGNSFSNKTAEFVSLSSVRN